MNRLIFAWRILVCGAIMLMQFVGVCAAALALLLSLLWLLDKINHNAILIVTVLAVAVIFVLCAVAGTRAIYRERYGQRV